MGYVLEEDCPECGGTGIDDTSAPWETQECELCKGQGVLSEEEE